MTSEDGGTTGRRSPLTGRAVVLVLVVAALVVSSVVPLRAYFEQRADLAELRARTAEQERRVAELEAQKRRWDDPAYVEAQARQRLHFVMPGEVGYVVLEPDEAPDPADDPVAERTTRSEPWYDALWGSVRAADAVADQADEPPARLGTGKKKSKKRKDGAGAGQ